ncbi:MAG: hypothetical protein AUI16_13565 [Alphaproteobacteria bacterium 13_2_20CM_2_64_7]|nr:MAG: hypothetical protein AUI16_13565 [Alphaproteobacteria bacterium 13_2_20CM_2_64_7]
MYLGSFGQNAQLTVALMLRSIAAHRECSRFHSRTALRCVSKHEGDAGLMLRDGASRLLRMRLPKTRTPRRLVRSLYFPVFLQTLISGLPEIGAQCAQVG